MESRGSSDQEDEQIVQIKEALMCPNGDNFEVLQTARFLNYTTTSIDDHVSELPLDAFVSLPESFDLKKSMATISFSGWGSPSVNWIEWVDAMSKSHASIWKKSGIHDAVISSRYQVKKNNDTLVALIEKWCLETNTFVFHWGEATVTLEDMIVLGGFSVIGNNVLAPIKREDMKLVEEKMKKVKGEIEVKLGKKCCTVSAWMKEMMNSGNDIEHEAFIVSWLSRFVYPNSSDLLRDTFFPAAIQLANGVRLALAPAVLAGIYQDLGVLKEHLAGYTERETVVVKSPFQLVQVWAFERFMDLQPPGQPSQLKSGEPRMARWHQHGCSQEDAYGYNANVRAVLDSAKETFDYRPYTRPLKNFKFSRFYLEDDSWVRVNSDDKHIVAFGRCLRFAKLVGLDCAEPYYPHRVALQFGYDQDVPGIVPARNETPELAWKEYIRPIPDEMLYVPARLHEGDVTLRYIRWWKETVTVLQLEAKKISDKLRASPPRHKHVTTTAVALKEATKHPVKMPEWVQRSPASTSSSDVKDLKGALRGTGEPKSQGRVTFQLPDSLPSPTRVASNTNTPSRMIPRVVAIGKESSSSSRGPRQTSSVPVKKNNSPSVGVSKEAYKSQSVSGSSSSSSSSLMRKKSQSVSASSSLKRKMSPKSSEVVNSRVQKSSQSSGVSKQRSKSSSVSGSSSSLPRKRSPRSPEAVSSSGYRNSPSPRVSNKSPSPSRSPSLPKKKKAPRSSETATSSSEKRNTETSSMVSRRETHQVDIGKAANNSVKVLEEIVTLKEHVGEGGEVTYQIPKQQFEDLTQGLQDVLQDLQSIKSAFNIQDN